MHYIIGSRGSKLALIQSEFVMNRLKSAYPEDSFEIKVIQTTGDKNQIQALDKIGSKGIFTDEIEKELLSGEISMAVHSMKDMPDTLAEGLIFSKAWDREDPRDVLILRDARSLDDLPEGSVIGTGSKRRAFQLKKLRPDLEVVGIRGNVDTRIRKLHDREEGLDGIILAAAGLKRLGREAEISQYFKPEELIPAPAQGVLAIELRADDKELLSKVDSLASDQVQLAVDLERGFLKAIGGDCHLPVGAYFSQDGKLYALFGNEEGSKLADVVIKCGKCAGENTDEVIRMAVDEINKKI